MSPDCPEISDVIVAFDEQSLARLPVNKTALVERFRSMGDRLAARVVARIPDIDGILDPDAVDALLLRVHCEMQRLSEEFQHGQRLCNLLRPLVHVLRQHGIKPPIRLVDLGCGTGYAIRWLAMHGGLGDDVEVVGTDFNRALVAEAQRLASQEHLRCRFMAANAFHLPDPGHLLFSTGVIHHFRGESLAQFFANHEGVQTKAFLHNDFQPTLLAPLGSWFWHVIRMRTALARHDGTLSVVRAYSARELLDTARRAAPGFACGMYGRRIWNTPVPRIFHTLLGIRPELRDDFFKALGRQAGRMESL